MSSFQALRLGNGEVVHSSGPDGSPACGRRGFWWLPTDDTVNCAKEACLSLVDVYMQGKRDGVDGHLREITHFNAALFHDPLYRLGLRAGRAEAIDEELTALMVAAQPPHHRRKARIASRCS